MVNRQNRKKLSHEVLEGILKIIEDGKVPIGGQLPPESELIEEFDVSRTSVREAVKSLTALGVLEIRPGVGTFVVGEVPGPLRMLPGQEKLNGDTGLQDLMEFRLIYEPAAAALAATRCLPEEIDAMEACVLALEKGVSEGIRPPEDLEFHLILARATRNSAIMDVSNLTARFYLNDTQLPDDLDVAGHRAVLEAIRNRDPQAAKEAMHTHLTAIQGRNAHRKKGK